MSLEEITAPILAKSISVDHAGNSLEFHRISSFCMWHLTDYGYLFIADEKERE